jgi:FKBP-type peptidyl-prolyl cis-trans isomerase (trigger factor)
MIDDEIKNMLANYGLFNSGQQDPRTFNVAPFRDNLGAPAKQRIQTSIAVDKIADKEKIEVEDSEVEEKYQTIATSAGVDVETVKNHYKTNNGGEMLKLEIRRDKVLELLKSRSKVKFVAKKAEPEVKEEEKTE